MIQKILERCTKHHNTQATILKATFCYSPGLADSPQVSPRKP